VSDALVLRFTTNVEDMVEYSMEFMRRSKATRRSQRLGVVASIALISIVITMAAIALQEPWVYGAIPVVAIVLALALPGRYRSFNRSLVRKIHEETMEGLSEEDLVSTMTLEEDGVRFDFVHGKGLLILAQRGDAGRTSRTCAPQVPGDSHGRHPPPEGPRGQPGDVPRGVEAARGAGHRFPAEDGRDPVNPVMSGRFHGTER
jgi:hypothetical protein